MIQYRIPTAQSPAVIRSVPKPVTVASVCESSEMGRFTVLALDVGFGIPADTEVNRAIDRLNDLISREQSKRGHHSYDMNQHIALAQHRRTLVEAVEKQGIAA